MDTISISATIIGGSGYTGGELIRLLLFHLNIEINQIISSSLAKKLVSSSHPNLRKVTELRYSSPEELESCDVLFLCLPHGQSLRKISEFIDKADKIIDLSSDFRLKSEIDYKTWYGEAHPHSDLLKEFTYGLPELHREKIKKSKFIACGGCNATASILGLYPLFKNGIIRSNEAIIDVKAGSSESGKKFSLSSHHPERSGSVRSYMPVNHRHTAEIIQELSINDQNSATIHFSATSVEMVRGILATCHVFLKEEMTEKDIWKIYRQEYGKEPFIRLIKSRKGIFRFPDPKLLSGTNYCDIGFELDPKHGRLVVISAIDNLVKGSAGQAIQSMNLMFNLEETLGLEFCGLHPI